MRSLGMWLPDLQRRIAQLSDWTGDCACPQVTWLTGLFNPQSFLTAIMQASAQAEGKELDKLAVGTEVRKEKEASDVQAPAREGAYFYGLSLEGARWNLGSNMLENSKPREMSCAMPVIRGYAQSADKVEPNTFPCPCYKTQMRGPTYVFTASLKTKAPAAKWTLGDVVLILDLV